MANSEGLSAAERAAVRQRAAELRKKMTPAELAAEMIDTIAALPEPDRTIASRIHAVIDGLGLGFDYRLWYGFPAYYKNGKIVCFVKQASKFKDRYQILGFESSAKVDDGTFWPVAYAITELTPAIEAEIAGLVKRAVA